MFDYGSVLKKNPNGVLATRDGENVETRVFQFLFQEGNRVYFCTSSQKPVYAQLQADPNVSFCTFPPDYSPVVSVNGKAVFVEDAALKARALDENPPIKRIYQTPENPSFRLFYVNVRSVKTFDFKEGPKVYSL